MSKEHVFEYLRRMDTGEAFEEGIVRNWYIARAYVLNLLKDKEIGPDSEEQPHFAVLGDSPLMLSVARQVALSAHFINFEEYDTFGRLSGRNRTVITIVSQREEEEIVRELEKEEHFCHLLRYCKYSVYGETRNEGSYLDIELDIVREWAGENTGSVRITENDVHQWVYSQTAEDIYSVDTRKAILTSRVYGLGAVIDNLPAEDIHCARRYNMALDTFQYKLLGQEIKLLVDDEDWKNSLTAVKNGLSNIFCADCFESRALGIRQYAREKMIPEEEAWEKNTEVLSCSEHSRWVVEKLILGFLPLSDGERLRYESLFGKKRSDYAKRLKTRTASPSHIDLCSYHDLRRINPNDMKYDSFLMLAIPLILGKIQDDDKPKK